MPAPGHSAPIARAGISTHRFEYDRQFHEEQLLYEFQAHGAKNLPYTLRLFGVHAGKYGDYDDGLHIIVPHGLVVLAFAGGAVVPWIQRRFSVRTLLIATMLVAVVLGIIVAAS